MREFIGRKTVVLIEGMAKNSCGLLEGLTHNYLKVYLPFRPGLRNKLVLAQLKSFKEDGFLGEYIDKL